MSSAWRNILLRLSIVPLLAASLLTGGSNSPVLFCYFLLIFIWVRYLPPRFIVQSGALYTCMFALLLLLTKPAGIPAVIATVVEIAVCLLAALSGAGVARTIGEEQERCRRAEVAFQELSHDLTHRTLNLRTTLEALNQAQSKLQETDRNKTNFLANAAHELRTPLSAIRSYSEILLSYDDIDCATKREFLEIIQNESVRLTKLVNDVLNIVSIVSGKLEVNISRIDPGKLIEECIRLMMPMAREKGLRLVAEIAPESGWLMGDKGQLLQVLINLTNNAIKFTSKGEVTLGMVPGESAVEFYVSDTGEGIFPEERGKIFEEFYRILGCVPNRPAGSGLGLSICKSIVEYHGGTIGVESELGKGSTFRFSLPTGSEPGGVAMKHAVASRPHQPNEFHPFLVITHNTVKRQFLRKSLEDLGYKTLGATSSESARSQVLLTPTDLIITDVAMTPSERRDLENWARSDNIPLFMAYFHAVQGGGIQLAIDGYIWKPIDEYQLLEVIGTLIKPHADIAILSLDSCEARLIQIRLSIEGYSTRIFSGVATAIRSCSETRPDGIIIGSFDGDTLDDIVDNLLKNAGTATIPRFLVIEMQLNDHAKLVTIPLQTSRPMSYGLSQLIAKIESELF